MRDKALGYLGMMRKAGMLETGEINAGNAVKSGTAKLLLLSSDAGANARRRAEGFTQGRRTQLIELPFTKDEVSQQIGKANTALAAVMDKGFAVAFMKTLAQLDPKYEDALKKLGDVPKAQKSKTGTRRNNA